MLNNWHKKEKPFLSTTSLTGGAGGFAVAGGGIYQWDGLMTLTDAGAGRYGSGLADARTNTTGGLPAAVKSDTNIFNVTSTGIRDIRIGQTGTYEITARGASTPKGSAGQQTARFNLEENEVLRLLVGRASSNNSQGAGGTFVVVYPGATVLGDDTTLQPLYNDDNFLMAMGGAAGNATSLAGDAAQSAVDSDANMTRQNTSCGNPGNNGGGGGGGRNGSGGGGGGLKGNGGTGYAGAYGGSAGSSGNGNNYPPVAAASGGDGGSQGGTTSPGGLAFLAGGTGGEVPGNNQLYGGFGGGGSFQPWNSNGGGGGGYSGGGGGGYDPGQAGGSGGSSRVNTPSPRYVSGSANTWTAVGSQGSGRIEINLV